MTTTAILERLLHLIYLLSIHGESYRLKDKRQSVLLALQQLLNAGSEVTRKPYYRTSVGQC